MTTAGLRRAVDSHLGSAQVSRVIYGSIIGLALVVALEEHPPAPGVVAGSLLATAVAVGLAEIYSEIMGTETRTGRRIRREEMSHLVADAVAVGFGIAFPAVFFVLSAAHAIESDTAFTLAKWSGLGLIAFYGFCAARLAGAGVSVALLQALGAGLVGAMLIALKALLH